MKCPTCDADTYVKKTIRTDDESAYVRRRVCRNGHDFYTKETVYFEGRELASARARERFGR